MPKLGTERTVYLDDRVFERLEEYRQLNGMSLSRMVNLVLREALGLRDFPEVRPYRKRNGER